ncbi:ABC-type protease/lipase transport system, ATPase and permease components [Serratia marcescens]|uniref:DUF4214 domain-containing protein n=1 Tax=Serratia TaxID=613 RepID=UPI000E3C1825|nr:MULTISPECIES: DUF4214 domain-containing protein [Serratia]MBH3006246.1 DUF4214 domain-containing protein [Serratia ureilytica]MBH3107162.1 DUF4214 domain-containing protein [Serratia ureilytica]MBH3124246.1 DUF4214 domain-containing protein [Serratia ureilytica]RFS93216.1 DUF4214 domain-containing protein [Serratia marcescens]CAI0861621.1 ABC-type protease/lipase transport system, ATPase and permease components [Serratia marcescens]
MSLLTLQQGVAKLFYAILGKKADDDALNYFAKKLEKGDYTQSELANMFIRSQDGQHRYDGLTTSQKIQYIYQNTTGAQPDALTLNALTTQVNAGKSLGNLTTGLIANVINYTGNDAGLQAQQQHLQTIVNTTLYPSELVQPSQLSAAADVQGLYYLLGSMTHSAAVQYWSDLLVSGKKNTVDIANAFIATKSYIHSLSNDDFVRKIFSTGFGKSASESDLQKYVTGLNDHSETRGDVIVRMMDDIRNDAAATTAKQNFTAATHVYGPGELPPPVYTEAVMALYLTVAGTAADATALDTFSRLLASGTSHSDLLKMLSSAYQFRNAGDYQKIYLKLYGQPLDSASAQAILLKAGNDNIKASSLIIDAFREGKFPLDNHPYPPQASLLKNFDIKLGDALGYQRDFNGTFSLSDSGKLVASINGRGDHEVTNAEIVTLSQINLNVNTPTNLDVTALKNVNSIVLSGLYATNTMVLSSLGNKFVSLRLNDANIANADAALPISFLNVVVEGSSSLNNAHTSLMAKNLLWAGNGVNGGANHIGSHFLAEAKSASSSTITMLSANFITKSVYLTTNQLGNLDGSIVSNVNQFRYFDYIDLTHYKGTGDIYLDGKWVASEGSKVFDFGLFSQNAGIHNAAYANVSSLTQAELPLSNGNGYTGHAGGIISAYSGDLTLLNVSNDSFKLAGGLTSNSHIHIHDTRQSDTRFTLEFTKDSGKFFDLDMGTFSFTSDHKQTLEVYMGSNAEMVQNRTMTLSGGDNSISDLLLTGAMYAGDQALVLNLTVAADFSDNLQTIRGNDYIDRRFYSDMKLQLVAEKGGTGGGSFYNTLNSLANKDDFSTVINELNGHQLTIDDTGLTVLKAQVKGNTTVDSARTLSFNDSKIDDMVTLNVGYQNSVINVGDAASQWVFSKAGDKTATLYGSATSATELQAAFSGLTGANNAQALFSQVLAKMTNGASTHQLAEVGLLKLDKSVYVIVDKNHNQTFDADDVVFSIGNQDPYLAAVSLHYHAPAVTVNGLAAENSLSEAFA